MDEKPENHMRRFGLIGKAIGYSFSRNYFKNKFKEERINDAVYQNFDLDTIMKFPKDVLETKGLSGLNVTIPYKEQIIPFLDSLSKKAKAIGAVNTIKINKNGTLKGYNTDCYGFKKTIKPYLKKHHKKALILGTGGASKAIAFVLEDLDIDFQFVSRQASKKAKYSYEMLNEAIIKEHSIIINCSPVGTFPDVDVAPNIVYSGITSSHILFDLIYNPKQTLFLKRGLDNGATTINGYKMLEFQAEKAWEIWNK